MLINVSKIILAFYVAKSIDGQFSSALLNNSFIIFLTFISFSFSLSIILYIFQFLCVL